MAVRKAKVTKHKKPGHHGVRRARVAHRRHRLRNRFRKRHGSWEWLLPKSFVKEAKRALQMPALVAGAVLVIVAILFTLARQPAQVPPPAPIDPAAQAAASELDRALAGLQGKPVGERVAYWAMNLSPEWVSRLRSLPGAPRIQDIAPLVPPNFDCTTFVETVASLARSATSGDFFRKLVELRYHGTQTGFFDRNHFPEADWIPDNARVGILRDVTAEVAGQSGIEAKSESKRINRASWFALQLKKGEFRGLGVTEPVAEWHTPALVTLPFLSTGDAGRFIDRLPLGSIVNVVREVNPKQWVLITHQAIVLRMGGVTYLRHSTRDGRIHTVALDSYLKANSGAQWAVVGLNVLSLSGQ